MNDAQIKHMVDRFLQWKLPHDFLPDNGIGFNPIANEGTSYQYTREPVGTNLFTAVQAKRMVRFMLEGLPQSDSIESRLEIVEQRLNDHDRLLTPTKRY